MADQDKTEKPTQRRLDQARKDGRFPVSKEFVSAVQFLTLVSFLVIYGTAWFGTLRDTMRSLLVLAFESNFDAGRLTKIIRDVVFTNIRPLAMAGGAVMAVTLVMQVASTGLGVSLNKLAPDFKRLNPAGKLKQLPSQNLPAFFQALVLLPSLAIFLYFAVQENLSVYLQLPLMSIPAGAMRVAMSLQTLLWRAASLFLVFGLVDLFRQRKRYAKQMRMSKQEIKQESKDQEGNPQIKMRIRRLQRDAARRNMMKEVSTATALIVNPTHYAVAIRYQMDSGGAPTVVAKGKNYLAARIRKIALQNQVPIVENPPLAQALYKSVNVGQEIPAHLYKAVAEILAYIFKLMNGRLPG